MVYIDQKYINNDSKLTIIVPLLASWGNCFYCCPAYC
jgi:hypothetical protein